MPSPPTCPVPDHDHLELTVRREGDNGWWECPGCHRAWSVEQTGVPVPEPDPPPAYPPLP